MPKLFFVALVLATNAAAAHSPQTSLLLYLKGNDRTTGFSIAYSRTKVCKSPGRGNLLRVNSVKYSLWELS